MRRRGVEVLADDHNLLITFKVQKQKLTAKASAPVLQFHCEIRIRRVGLSSQCITLPLKTSI
jgi:hypothetical protein